MEVLLKNSLIVKSKCTKYYLCEVVWGKGQAKKIWKVEWYPTLDEQIFHKTILTQLINQRGKDIEVHCYIA